MPHEVQLCPLTQVLWHVQDKVLAQLEKDGKNKPKAASAKPVTADAKKTAASGKVAEKAAKAEEAEEEVDPVEKALNKYGIIMENPWEKGVK
jgi:ribosomal protein L12E/L44/L45/RPP1/RPP2